MQRAILLVPVSVLTVAVASYFAFLPAASGTLRFWALAGGPTLALAAIAAVWASRRQGLLRDWFEPRWGDFSQGALGAVALYGAAWVFARFVCPAGSPRAIWVVSLYGQIGDPRDLQAHAPAVAAAVAVLAVAEELLWRGAILQLLAEQFGSRFAWALAAALYALANAPTAWALRAGGGPDPVLAVAALGGGLLWGAMVRFTGRLGPPIVAHALFDWAVLMMFPLWGGLWAR
jgi:membrane protease YdiL (CAAX protease family)